MMNNLGGMMKKVQQMQQKLTELGEEMEARQFSASVGGGSVTAEVNGKGAVLSVSIAAEMMVQDEREMLEELIVLAVNSAKSEAESAQQQAIKEITGGLPLPPGLSLPF